MPYKRRRIAFRRLRKGKRRGSVLKGRPLKRRRLTFRKSGIRPRRPVGIRDILTPKRLVKCVWVSAQTQSAALIGTGNLVWGTSSVQVKMNDAWDPLSALTGSFNQASSSYRFWSRLYDHCIVKSAVLTTKFHQSTVVSGTGNLTVPMIVGVLGDDDQTVGSYTG